MLTAIRQWVIRTMMKAKGETGIVQTMPKKDIVELNTQITAQRLMQNGINPESLKNADQVENAIIAIENRPKVQQGITSTKSADVFDLKGKKIKDTKNIMGGEELPPGDPDLPPPGSRGGPDDIAAPVQSAEETIKNMIEAENKKGIANIQKRILEEDREIENLYGSAGFGKDQKVDAEFLAEYLAENAGKVYDDLPTKERLDLYEQAFQGLTKKRFDPDGMATGGRAGFKDGPDQPGRRKFMKIMGGLATLPILGKFVKPAMPLIKKGAELSAPALDKIIEVVMSAGKLVSQSGRRLKELTTKKKLKDIEVEEDMMDGPSYTIKTKDKTIYYRPGRQDEGGLEDDIIEVIEDTVTKKAGGGIARMLGE